MYRLSLIIISIYTLFAIYGESTHWYYRAADTTAPYNQVHEANRYQPPIWLRGWHRTPDGQLNILGSDNLGRDVLSRLIQGTRIAYHVGIVTSLIAIPLGTLLGLLAGYYGGRIDSLINTACATVASMPGLLFILAISLIVGQGLLGIYLGIGLTTWVGICRTIRAETARQRNQTYVQAAQTLGYSDGRILIRHILPNTGHLLLITFSIRFPQAISTEVLISFLGIGVQNEPSWGIMINNARLRLWQGNWWEAAFVTLAIFLLVLSFNHLADTLRDRLDPALRTTQA